LRGIKFGRRRTIDRSQVEIMRSQGIGATDIAREMKIARSTVYKIIGNIKKYG
ncbi:helix-turn-helix domain-containing protein, partial [Escherichia coli]|nr:helix-turn-helix domain-containing protein [Escherichia coli]